MLDWDEIDFLSCLEVEPFIDDGYAWEYEVHSKGLILLVSVIPHEDSVTFSLFHNGNDVSIISFSLLVFSSVRLGKDKRGEHLFFSNCLFSTDPYPEKIPGRTANLTMELFIKPNIRFVFG